MASRLFLLFDFTCAFAWIIQKITIITRIESFGVVKATKIWHLAVC